MRVKNHILIAAVVLVGSFTQTALRAEVKAGSPQQLNQIKARAITYLRSKGQSSDGSFSSAAGPGVTALITTGLLRNGVSPKDPMVAKALAYLEGFVQPSGGIHQKGDGLPELRDVLGRAVLQGGQ